MSHSNAVDIVDDRWTEVVSDFGSRPLISWQPSGPWSATGWWRWTSRYERERPESVHQPIIMGWRNPANFYHWGRSLTCTGAHLLYQHPSGDSGFEFGKYHFTNDVQAPWVAPPGSDRNLCLIKARGSLKANGAMLGVGFLERKKTASMIGGKMELVMDSIASVVRRKPVGVVREVFQTQGRNRRRRGETTSQYRKRWLDSLTSSSSRRFANEWLEVQYGWKPTLQDIRNGVDHLSKYESTMDGRSVFVKETLVGEDASGTEDVPLGTNADVRVFRDWQQFTAVTIRLDYNVACPAAQTAAQIGLLNPLSIAWELVPFSFVLDWAVPIGPWLDSLDATAGLSFKGGSISTIGRYAATESFGGFRAPGYRLVTFYKGRKSSFWFERQTYGSSPVPYPPWFDFKVGSGRFKNALALAAQQLHRYGRR